MSMCKSFLGASLVPPRCLLGASLVPPWCLLGASLVPPCTPWLGPRVLFGAPLCPLPPPQAQNESLKTHLVSTKVSHLPFEWPTWFIHHPYIPKVASMWHQSSLKVIAHRYNTFQKSLKFIGKMSVFWKITFIHPGPHHNDPKVIIICQKWAQNDVEVIPK